MVLFQTNNYLQLLEELVDLELLLASILEELFLLLDFLELFLAFFFI